MFAVYSIGFGKAWQVVNAKGATFKASNTVEDASQPTPSVAMTANPKVSDRQAGMDAGMAGHLAKPIHAAALREAIERALA